MLEPDPVELAVERLLHARDDERPPDAGVLIECLQSLPAERAIQGAIRLIAVDIEGVLLLTGGAVPRERYEPIAAILPETVDPTALLNEAARGPLLDHPPAPGDCLPRWIGESRHSLRLVSELGRGGYSRVFAAEDFRQDGAPVAVKGPWVGGGRSEDAVGLLEREGEILISLDHPNVLTLHRVERDAGDIPVLVLELLAMPELRGLAGHLPVDQVMNHLIDLASALEHLRKNQVVHRDVTLGNVGLGSDGRPRLFDFGLSVRMGERRRHEGERAGTVSTMTLEQQFGISREIDSRIDVAGLGVLGLQLLSFEDFHIGSTTEENVVNWMMESPAIALDGLGAPGPLLEVLRKAVARDAAHRHPTPGALERELIRVAEEIQA